jgi:hypothetical protein
MPVGRTVELGRVVANALAIIRALRRRTSASRALAAPAVMHHLGDERRACVCHRDKVRTSEIKQAIQQAVCQHRIGDRRVEALWRVVGREAERGTAVGLTYRRVRPTPLWRA